MRWNRILSIVATVCFTPVLAGAGCIYDNHQPALALGTAGNNGRAAMMATQFGKTTKAVLLDKSTVNFDTASSKASLDITADTFHDIKDMTPSGSTPGLFFNADATAYVMPQPDADGNGRDDTFFVATEHNLPGQRHERTLSYVGPFTPTGVIDPYTRGGVKATYTGKAGIMGTIGNDHVSAEGPLQMDVDFGEDASIFGTASFTGVQQADHLSFNGNLNVNLSDFTIKNAALHKGSPGSKDFLYNVVASGGEGVGSFIGDKGQGTMGAFSISDTINGTSDVANVQGWFIGSADSLK
jgi:hypothetical protein